MDDNLVNLGLEDVGVQAFFMYLQAQPTTEK
jgi:hypothetical protein